LQKSTTIHPAKGGDLTRIMAVQTERHEYVIEIKKENNFSLYVGCRRKDVEECL
jgi:hypothetical protein